MSNYAMLIEEYGEEKIDYIFENSQTEISGAISIQGLINIKEEVKDEFPELDVFENDDEFFDMLDLKPKDIAFRVHFGDYNPHHEYVTLDGYENLKSFDENGYKQFIKDSDVDIISEYLNQVRNNSAELTDEVYQAIKEIANEYR